MSSVAGRELMMHDDQVNIDIYIARQMIRDQFPQYRHEDVTSVGSSGTVNAIFRVGSRSAARFPLRAMKPAKCADMLRSEAAAMVEIGEHCSCPTPRPIGLGAPGPRYPMPWALQTWIEGEVATPHGLSGSTTFALDLAHLVASLRQADTSLLFVRHPPSKGQPPCRSSTGTPSLSRAPIAPARRWARSSAHRRPTR